MPVKHLCDRLKFALAFGAFLMTFQIATPAPAQTGNQSDATGPIPSSSDIAGGAFQPQTLGGSQVIFQGGSSVQTTVNQAAATVTTQLSANALTAPTGTPIPATAQQNVLNILTSNSQASPSINTVTTALSTGVGSPPAAAVQALTSKLAGLLADRKVSPQQLLAAIRAYNELIRASNAEFLSNPPAELRAIQVALSRLIAATGS